MKTLLPRLLSLLAAAALGGGLTFAILPRKAAPPAPPAPTVAAPATPSIPLVLAEAAEPPQRNELAEHLFEGYHKSVVSDFQARPGFGISRTAPHPGFSPYLDTNFSRFGFSFIGNDPEKRKYEVEDPAYRGVPLVFHISEAYDRREKARNALMIQNIDPFQRAPVHDPGALFDKDLKPDVSLPTEDEFAILARFEATPEKIIEFHAVGGGTLGYGALRASASCLSCHEKEEGALLGLFRYRFEHGPAGWVKDLAVK